MNREFCGRAWFLGWFRACLKTLGDRRGMALGLQALAEQPVGCRPGALTGRVFKHPLRSSVVSSGRPGFSMFVSGIRVE